MYKVFRCLHFMKVKYHQRFDQTHLPVKHKEISLFGNVFKLTEYLNFSQLKVCVSENNLDIVSRSAITSDVVDMVVVDVLDGTASLGTGIYNCTVYAVVATIPSVVNDYQVDVVVLVELHHPPLVCNGFLLSFAQGV